MERVETNVNKIEYRLSADEVVDILIRHSPGHRLMPNPKRVAFGPTGIALFTYEFEGDSKTSAI